MAKKKQSVSGSKSNWKKDSQKLKLDLGSQPARSRLLIRLWWSFVSSVVFALVVWVSIISFKYFSREKLLVEYEKEVEWADLEITGCSSLPEEIISEMIYEFIPSKLDAVNLFELKEHLENLGQIKQVDISKDFPNTLVVKIIERLPVLMLATVDDDNELDFWGVDEHGVVYKPFDLRRMKALDLPFLQGIEIEEVVDGKTSIEGVDKIHYLLQLIKRDAYPVFNDLQSVSLEHFEGGVSELGAVIIFRGHQLKKILFGVENFEYQVVKLIGVLSVSGTIRLEKKEIDLSYSGDAIIR